MSKLDNTKTALSLVTGIGVSRIVSGMIDVVAPQPTIPGKAILLVAKYGISMLASDAVDRSNNEFIDAVANAVKESTKKYHEKNE